MRGLAVSIAGSLIAASVVAWFGAKVGAKLNAKANADVRSSYALERIAGALERISPPPGREQDPDAVACFRADPLRGTLAPESCSELGIRQPAPHSELWRPRWSL